MSTSSGQLVKFMVLTQNFHLLCFNLVLWSSWHVKENADQSRHPFNHFYFKLSENKHTNKCLKGSIRISASPTFLKLELINSKVRWLSYIQDLSSQLLICDLFYSLKGWGGGGGGVAVCRHRLSSDTRPNSVCF